MRPNTGRSPDGRKLSEAAARSGGVDRHDGWRTACPLSGVRMVKQTFVNGVVSGGYAPQFPPFNLLIVVPKISRSFRIAASPRGVRTWNLPAIPSGGHERQLSEGADDQTFAEAWCR